MNNYNIAEKYLKKGLTQSEGMLGNEIIYKLNADLNENLGVVLEFNMKPKEALNYYKKSLKAKFTLFGENNEEVLDLQYKISSVYISLKQYKEASEIMTAMTEVILKEKLDNTPVDNFYRYGVYFYTTGMLLLKNGKNSSAREYLNNALVMWKDIVSSDDPAIKSLQAMIKICDKR
jgi:tetratricopeptide (TPR) repeat protein